MTSSLIQETGKLQLRQKYEKIIGGMRQTFSTGKTLAYEFRLNQLKNLKRLLEERVEEITEALYKDLRKPKIEACFYEIEAVKIEITNAIRDLKRWMRPKTLPINLIVMTDRGELHDNPYGLVLVIGSWNYPFLLLLSPLSGAISGGNCVLIKPSELASHSAAALAKLLPQYLDSDCYKVLQGNAEETTILLENKFDYIFSTSSTKVGKIVMSAAAKHLTPVTLELGGKSPVYIDDSANIAESAKRILWGKILNLGQTCIAPDYVLCSKRTEEVLISKFKQLLERFFGTNNLQSSGDIARLINKANFERLKNLIIETKGDVVIGGDTDIEDLWISPTVVVNVKESDVLMDSEIFGPILPIMTCDSPEEALIFINSRPKPLSIYLFTKNKSTMKTFKERTSSGALLINDVCVHTGFDGLPFGGVGDSGMGAYHWQYSYDTFVHRKAVLTRNFGLYSKFIGEIRYPPYEYTNFKIKLTELTMFWVRFVNLPQLPRWSRESILFLLFSSFIFYHLFLLIVNL